MLFNPHRHQSLVQVPPMPTRRDRCKGFLVAVEGIDGSGKTDLLNNLIKERTYLISGYDGAPLAVRQPGGSVYGEAVRDIARQAKIDSFTQALIYASSHYDTYVSKIVPYMNNDGIVIADRFINTLFAYQGLFGKQSHLVMDILLNIPDFSPPDLTIYLSLPLDAAMKRQGKRGVDDDRYSEAALADKIRLKGWYDALHGVSTEPEFKMEDNYLIPAVSRYQSKFMNPAEGSLVVIDASLSREVIAEQAYSAITRQLEKITCVNTLTA